LKHHLKTSSKLEVKHFFKLAMTTLKSTTLMTIGQCAKRASVTVSTLRFYEERGLVPSLRNAGGQRIYPRASLRRIAFVRAAQAVGLSLEDIAHALATLPDSRSPTAADWAKLSAQWVPTLDARIATLIALRDNLTSCIGCGCLSLKKCALYNPQDRAALNGNGARAWVSNLASRQ
jgi:MerR family transcriptional regulator, redox-sensitive transcriptional activator SoxR